MFYSGERAAEADNTLCLNKQQLVMNTVPESALLCGQISEVHSVTQAACMAPGKVPVQ